MRNLVVNKAAVLGNAYYLIFEKILIDGACDAIQCIMHRMAKQKSCRWLFS